MIRSGIARLGIHFFKTSVQDLGVNRIKECTCVVRFLTSDSALPFHIDDSKVSINERGTSLMLTLRKVGIKFGNVTDIRDNSAIFKIDNHQILETSSTLLEYGFSKDSVKSIIKFYPELFYLKNSELSRLLLLWHQVGFGEPILLEILSTNPQLIECMGPNVADRIRFLLPYFNSLRNVGRLLINVPNVVYENWGSLKEKLDYLHSYRIPMSKVANCEALKLSLLEMKTRFTFLERAGMYKHEDPKKNTLSKNPTINNILCSSDRVFAENICKLSLVEFEAFTELFKLENIDEKDGYDEESDYEYNSE